MAPHVRAAIGTVQAKHQHGARPPGHRQPAPHVAQALRGQPPAQAKKAPGAAAPPAAPHVKAALSQNQALQRKAAAAAGRPAAHVAAAVAGARSVSPKAAPGQRTAAPHLLAAQARTAAPGKAQAQAKLGAPGGASLPAAHLAAALAARSSQRPAPAVQKARDLTAERTKIHASVAKVNSDIVATHPTQPNFFVPHVNSLQDQQVQIRGLGSTPLKLDAEQSGLSNLAYSVKDLYAVPPEVQFGVVSHKTKKKRHLRISANKKAFNNKIRTGVGKSKVLRDFYKSSLRPFHVSRRAEQLRRGAQDLKVAELNAILAAAYKDESTDKDVFYAMVNQRIAMRVHAATRRHDLRKRMKSGRKIAYGSHADMAVEVAANENDFHAESAILDETLTDPQESLDLVIGTKVPCIACTTFFRGKGVATNFLDHTSGAWLSQSSLTQLGFAKGDIEAYMAHIHSVLGGVTLYQHNDKDGEIATSQQTIDDDPGTDSEDEDAMGEFDFHDAQTVKQKNLKARIKKYRKSKFV